MERPILKIKLSALDWLLELLSLAILLFSIYWAFRFYTGHKDIIYTIKARAKAQRAQRMLIFTFLSVFFYVCLTLMSQVPHTFKYPISITAENAETEYTKGLRMLRIVKLVMVTFILLSVV